MGHCTYAIHEHEHEHEHGAPWWHCHHSLSSSIVGVGTVVLLDLRRCTLQDAAGLASLQCARAHVRTRVVHRAQHSRGRAPTTDRNGIGTEAAGAGRPAGTSSSRSVSPPRRRRRRRVLLAESDGDVCSCVPGGEGLPRAGLASSRSSCSYLEKLGRLRYNSALTGHFSLRANDQTLLHGTKIRA